MKPKELDVPKITAVEKRHSELSKLNATDPRKSAEVDRLAGRKPIGTKA